MIPSGIGGIGGIGGTGGTGGNRQKDLEEGDREGKSDQYACLGKTPPVPLISIHSRRFNVLLHLSSEKAKLCLHQNIGITVLSRSFFTIACK